MERSWEGRMFSNLKLYVKVFSAIRDAVARLATHPNEESYFSKGPGWPRWDLMHLDTKAVREKGFIMVTVRIDPLELVK